ncbi:hypothetical protein SGO26_30370 (plasmid) [Cupriavidus metallidurans]|uniref:hypothetical protein n=1 Tax=Cupriavidus TaxID=106589 RepID=UPI0011EFAA0D|nr:hypothetical protein [Cupriavidus campinensis]
MMMEQTFLMRIDDPTHGKILVCQIDNRSVVSRDALELAEILRKLGRTAEDISANASKLLVGIGGYDADSRELYEIEAVRAFIQDLTARVPWWFALLHPTLSLTWICCLIAKPKVTRHGNSLRIVFDPAAAKHALGIAIGAASAHLLQIRTPEWEADTILQNLSITANELLQGLNPVDADPLVSRALRARSAP